MERAGGYPIDGKDESPLLKRVRRSGPPEELMKVAIRGIQDEVTINFRDNPSQGNPEEMQSCKISKRPCCSLGPVMMQSFRISQLDVSA